MQRQLFANSTPTEQPGQQHDHDQEVTVTFQNLLVLLLQAILMVLIIAGNTLVVLAVFRSASLQTTTNYFVVSLALADLLVGLMLPYHATVYLLPFLAKQKYFCLGRFASLLLPCCASVANLLLISIDRFLAIVYPLHYPSLITRPVAKALILCNWCQSTLWATIPFYSNMWQDDTECILDAVMHRPYIIASSVFNIFVIGIIMIALYSKILQEALKQRQTMRSMMNVGVAGGSDSRVGRTSAKDVNTTKTLAIVIGTFLTCWMPFMAVVALKSMGCTPWHYHTVYSLFILLGVLNSGLNPIIYAWKNRAFREAFKKILGRKTNIVPAVDSVTGKWAYSVSARHN